MPDRYLLIAALLALPGIACCSSPGTGTPLSANNFFVATNGNDSNPGTLTSPFLTFHKCQTAMQKSSSSIKTCTIRAGTYSVAATLILTSSDNGETWQYYPPDGVNTAVIDGGNSIDPIFIRGSNITINGLKIQNFYAYGVRGTGSNNTVENCDIGFNVVTSWQSAGVEFEGTVPNTHIANNYVHDVGSQGIALFDNWSGSPGPGSVDGSVIENNVVLRAVQRKSDGGSIYLEQHGGSVGSHTVIRNNFVRDYGAAGLSGQSGIYLDQGSNNVLVTGNVIGPPAKGSVGTGNAGAFGFQASTGFNVTFSGNIIDLGDSGRGFTAAFWYERGSGPQNATNGVVFSGNVILSGFTGNQNTNFTGETGISYYEHPSYPTLPTIQNNVYYNYAGGQVRTDGNRLSDSHPIFENPQISGWTYRIADDSPVFHSPVNLQPIVGGWGPPGFVIPRTGTAPSAR